MSFKMTPKRFVNYKLSGKTTAEGFLSAHWEFLQGQSYLSDILGAYERRELLPTPTVQMCQAAVLSHIVEAAVSKAPSPKGESVGSTKVIRRTKGGEAAQPEAVAARYEITMYYKKYNRDRTCSIVQGDTFPANSGQEAMRIADRKLADQGDAVYATITNTFDRPITINVNRDDAIARLYGQRKGPSTRNTYSGGGSIGFGMKAKNDRSYFSRG